MGDFLSGFWFGFWLVGLATKNGLFLGCALVDVEEVLHHRRLALVVVFLAHVDEATPNLSQILLGSLRQIVVNPRKLIHWHDGGI